MYKRMRLYIKLDLSEIRAFNPDLSAIFGKRNKIKNRNS